MVRVRFTPLLASLMITAFCGCQDPTPAGNSEVRCPGSLVGDTTLAPTMAIAGLDRGDDTVRGTANNVDARVAQVVLWARTDRYYVQPLIDDPFTTICSDGSWENWTHPWDRMVALLVDSTYEPGATRLYHPSADPGVLAWDEFPAARPDRVIEFAGMEWTVKYFETHRFDPGPNYWSDRASDVWVDGEGSLHLTTAHRDGKWFSTEAFANRPLGYGEYTFRLSARVDSLDYRAVFAGFVYETVGREIDIEFSRALADPQNAQFVVQPFDRAGNILRWTMPTAGRSSHRFEWRSDRVQFTSWRGLTDDPHPDSIISAWTYTGSDIPPPEAARMRFNLWLFGGGPPLSGEPDEVVIRSFDHEPQE